MTVASSTEAGLREPVSPSPYFEFRSFSSDETRKRLSELFPIKPALGRPAQSPPRELTSASAPGFGKLSGALLRTTDPEPREATHGTYTLVPRPATAIRPRLHRTHPPDLYPDR